MKTNLINLPGEDEISPTVFSKFLSSRFIKTTNSYVLSRNNLQTTHIYTDKSTLANYAVYLSVDTLPKNSIIYHPYTISSNSPQHIGIVTKIPGQIVTSMNKEYFETLFLENLKEKPIIEKSDKKNYCYIQWDFNRVDFSKQLSFLSRLLEKLYEDIFMY